MLVTFTPAIEVVKSSHTVTQCSHLLLTGPQMRYSSPAAEPINQEEMPGHLTPTAKRDLNLQINIQSRTVTKSCVREDTACQFYKVQSHSQQEAFERYKSLTDEIHPSKEVGTKNVSMPWRLYCYNAASWILQTTSSLQEQKRNP